MNLGFGTFLNAGPGRRSLGVAVRLESRAVEIFNLRGDAWDGVKERKGWRSKYAGVGARIGAELIGGSMYELEPGDRLWPYHTHHANEEWLLVVRGTPTLRTSEGERELSEGDVACFRRGKEGAHQLSNGTGSPIRVLMLSTLIAPDVIEYLDSGKIGVDDATGEGILLSRPGPNLDYWDGED
jgi:uncharacterized cupin superfamily protein